MKNLTIELLHSELERVSDWTKNSDSKVAFLSVYYTAILGFVFSHHEALLNIPNTCDTIIYYVYSLALILGIGVFIFGIACLLKAVFPNIKNLSVTDSMFFFEHVGALTSDQFIEKLNLADEDTIKAQLAEQIHANSAVVRSKMKMIRLATIGLVVVAAILTVLLLL